MKKILCPTDFSPIAKNAAEYAANIAQIINAELVLFHLLSKVNEASEQYVQSRGIDVETSAEYFDQLAADITREFNIKCYPKIETSGVSLAKAIASNAAAFDLIVMGTDGPHDLIQYFNGSNSYNAAVTSTIPVIIVRGETVYKPIRNVLYAFDYLAQPKVPMAQLLPFTISTNSSITLLQVLNETPGAEMKKLLADVQYAIKSDFESATHLKFAHASSGDIADSIDAYMQTHELDLLALSTVERGAIENLFHESVIKKISADAEYPLFIFNH
jgi:nucleotide-binding universal stress UspA family protein